MSNKQTCITFMLLCANLIPNTYWGVNTLKYLCNTTEHCSERLKVC